MMCCEALCCAGGLRAFFVPRYRVEMRGEVMNNIFGPHERDTSDDLQ